MLENPKNTKKIIATAVVIAFILSIFLAVFPKPFHPYSALFLKPGSFSEKIPENGTIDYVFGIQNFEGEDSFYKIETFISGQKVRERTVFVKNNSSEEFLDFAFVDKSLFVLPAKVEIHATLKNSTYSVYFWIKE